MGRPATGRDPTMSLRIPSEERLAIEAWAAGQSPALTFSKALRYLAQRGLEAVHAEPASASKATSGTKTASRQTTHQRAK